MTRSYYELEDDVFIEGRWFLNGLFDSNGIELEARELRYGKPIDVRHPLRLRRCNSDQLIEVRPPLFVSRQRAGVPSDSQIPIDFTFAGHDLPVVTKEVAELLEHTCREDIQRFPVIVEGAREEYDVINVVALLPCVDKLRSDVESWWTAADGRPDKLGHPKSINKLVVAAECAEGHHVFRLDGWRSIVIVSDLLKDMLEKKAVKGVRFKSVN
jgi:hypothetical protein